MARSKFSFILQVVAALVLSAIPILHYPFAWFETLFHELSHGLSAVLTGGSIESIALNYNGSGLCTTIGGNRFLILVSGYTGSACWGFLVYISVTYTKAHSVKIVAALLAILAAFVGILWVRDIVTLSILLVIIIVFFVAYRYGSHQLTRSFIEFTGIYVVMNAIRSPLYLIDGRDIGDGSALSELTYIPEIFWVTIWALIGISILMLLYQRSIKSV